LGYAAFFRAEFIISAGQDALVQLWPLHPPSDQSYGPEFVLAGHTSNVCCLDVYDAGPEQEPTICSGSWDCSAIIWRNNLSVHTLQGHSAAVWAVLGLGDSDDSVLTAGADNLIMLWKKGKQALTFKGHTQAVRALVRLPQNPHLFASAGNDATVRIWNLDGQAVRVMDGHDSFIYSLSSMPSGEIISSGEDRTVRIWDPNSGQLTQTVTVPAISVWTVSACPDNGDIVCGSSDNMIRVFTRTDERLASSSELSQFEESVKASSVPSATVGDVKKSDLPTVAVLLSRRGKKEGEVAMAKNESNGAVEAYQWDGMKGDWSMVGTVVDGIGSTRKQLFEGKEYDYVFDVDIKDGEPPLKLPYNASGRLDFALSAALILIEFS
jgi:phospholipase A-2-activating protein